MTTLSAGSTASYTFTGDQSVTITVSGVQRAVMEVRRSGAVVAGKRFSTTQTVGPFQSGDVMTITAQFGAIDWLVIDETEPVTPSSGVIPTRGIGKTTYPDTIGGELLFWPFTERSGATATDVASNQVAQYAGSSVGRWDPWSGANFNGTNQRLAATNGPAGGFISSAMSACDLTTLNARDDMIHVFGVLGHPTTFSADGVVFAWGASQHAKGGWALGISSTGKWYWSHCPKGGTVAQNIFNMTAVKGINNVNTMTAFCLQIMSAAESGFLEVQMVSLPMVDEGGDGQNTSAFRRIVTKPTGTAAASRDVIAPITIGAWPTTDASTFSTYSNAGTGLLCLGVHRRPFDPGACMRVARSLRANPKQFPEGAKS